MKKGGIVFTLAIVLILMISISFVSAGLLGDFWDKITGKVTENETNDMVKDADVSLLDEEPKPCQTITRQFCDDQETPCPEEKDDDGCPTWDCDSCEREEPPGPLQCEEPK